VSVNLGALFTSQTAVVLSLSALSGLTEMQVSNDGGFASAIWEPIRPTRVWQITIHGNYVIPRTVYVRMRDAAGTIVGPFQDDIILDVTPPVGFVERDRERNAGAGAVALKIDANDDVSGVGEMQVSQDPTFRGVIWEPFAKTKDHLTTGSRAIHVRFRDLAGNISATFAEQDPLGTATPTPTITATPTTASGPTSTPTPTATAIVRVALATLVPPSSIPTPDTTTGGAAFLIPTVAAGTPAAAVLTTGIGSPFEATLIIPAPDSNERPLGVRIQPSTTLTGATIPTGVSVTKALAIQVFDPNSGSVRSDHVRALTLTFPLSVVEQILCFSNPGRVALLHMTSDGQLHRVAPSRLDCTAGILETRVVSTSSYAVATLSSSTAITIRSFVPISPRANAGV